MLCKPLYANPESLALNPARISVQLVTEPVTEPKVIPPGETGEEWQRALMLLEEASALKAIRMIRSLGFRDYGIILV